MPPLQKTEAIATILMYQNSGSGATRPRDASPVFALTKNKASIQDACFVGALRVVFTSAKLEGAV